MLDIPELLSMICQYLGLQDMARFALVNKEWHSIIIPYLWGDLSCLEEISYTGLPAFGRLILSDYHYEERQRKKQDKKRHGGRPSRLSTLAKYSSWIQWLPDPSQLVKSLSNICRRRRAKPELTVLQLLQHLYGHRCPRALIRRLTYSAFPNDAGNLSNLMAFMELLFPRVRSLYILSSFDSQPEFLRLKSLLDRCSTVLQSLEFHNNVLDSGEEEEKQRLENEQRNWTSLKKLSLITCDSYLGSKAFWTWLWKRCGQVEKLEIHMNWTVETTEGMRTHMPNLTEISMGGKMGSMDDDTVAALLSGSQKGWKTVELRESAVYGRNTIEALAKHLPTLEVLLLNGSLGFGVNNLVQVLSSSPHLKTLVSLDDFFYFEPLYANVFIDRDPHTGVFKTWECESSLQILKIKIEGIPRPDLKGNGVIKEAYRGQGQEIQGLVYDRLARLSNLETLWLGKELREHVGRGKRHLRDSLDMSLESGLHKLAGLKKLRELNVRGMRANIGVKEVQWMVEHWLRLHGIYGLSNKEATKWLRENHPGIALIPKYRAKWLRKTFRDFSLVKAMVDLT